MGFNIADTGKKRVVIIGGGFGGSKLANRPKGCKFQTDTLGYLPIIRQCHPSHLRVAITDLGHLQVFRIDDRCFFETT